jgi:hypothetical protein
MSGLGAEHVRVRPLEPGYGRGVGHVCPRGQTCPANLWNPARGPDMSVLTGVFNGMVDFLCFALHQLTKCIPLDSTELLELK